MRASEASDGGREARRETRGESTVSRHENDKHMRNRAGMRGQEAKKGVVLSASCARMHACLSWDVAGPQ